MTVSGRLGLSTLLAHLRDVRPLGFEPRTCGLRVALAPYGLVRSQSFGQVNAGERLAVVGFAESG